MRVATKGVTPATRKEDDRLRQALKNADMEKFKRAIKRTVSPRKKTMDGSSRRDNS
jgi:hypothetical protein